MAKGLLVFSSLLVVVVGLIAYFQFHVHIRSEPPEIELNIDTDSSGQRETIYHEETTKETVTHRRTVVIRENPTQAHQEDAPKSDWVRIAAKPSDCTTKRESRFGWKEWQDAEIKGNYSHTNAARQLVSSKKKMHSEKEGEIIMKQREEHFQVFDFREAGWRALFKGRCHLRGCQECDIRKGELTQWYSNECEDKCSRSILAKNISNCHALERYNCTKLQNTFGRSIGKMSQQLLCTDLFTGDHVFMKNIIYINPLCEIYKGCGINRLLKTVTPSFAQLKDWIICQDHSYLLQFMEMHDLPYYINKNGKHNEAFLVYEAAPKTTEKQREEIFTPVFIFEVFYAFFSSFEVCGFIPLDAGAKHYHHSQTPSRRYVIPMESGEPLQCTIAAGFAPRIVDVDRYSGIDKIHTCNMSDLPIVAWTADVAHGFINKLIPLTKDAEELLAFVVEDDFLLSGTRDALKDMIAKMKKMGYCQDDTQFGSDEDARTFEYPLPTRYGPYRELSDTIPLVERTRLRKYVGECMLDEDVYKKTKKENKRMQGTS